MGKFTLRDDLTHKNIRGIEQAQDATRKREEHQVIVATLQNRVVMLHSNPYIGKIFMYELDPSSQYRYQLQITFPVGNLIRMQIIDNLLVLHNLD